MIRLTDTHCHIHDSEFFPDGGEEPYRQALADGVHQMICVGTDVRSSMQAYDFANNHEAAFASFGIHPHDSKKEAEGFDDFANWCHKHKTDKTVAIGEIGLDYHYNNSPRDAQIALLEKQIALALELDLPISFHVREAFGDFWAIFNNFPGIRGVLHSFTDSLTTLEKALSYDLYIGVNGIVTFSSAVKDVVANTPLESIILETDAPFLTPAPLRGKINVPGNVGITASYVAALRDITVEELSWVTEVATTRLFF